MNFEFYSIKQISRRQLDSLIHTWNAKSKSNLEPSRPRCELIMNWTNTRSLLISEDCGGWIYIIRGNLNWASSQAVCWRRILLEKSMSIVTTSWTWNSKLSPFWLSELKIKRFFTTLRDKRIFLWQFFLFKLHEGTLYYFKLMFCRVVLILLKSLHLRLV